MRQRIFLMLMLLVAAPLLYSFCGFYVSKADTTLKNKTSQVILVRDGLRNVITMYNDFKGDVRDFAMVVPVPVVLAQADIKVVDGSLFQRLNDYSAPRLVEYYDENPCEKRRMYKDMMATKEEKMDMAMVTDSSTVRMGVTVEASYLVGEYDILILSAKESTGLKTWLNQNGYKIPASADEVLDPYIRSNLKFFVVKVNLKAKKQLGGDFLRPLQIRYNSPKFMLPIRLGMANADGDQDLLVYAFTRSGRVECTNYRNVLLPTGNQVPLFVKDQFGVFYDQLFSNQWKKENYSVAFLEYAWDVTPANYYHCDPCIAAAPSEQDLMEAGVWWIRNNWEDYSDVASDVQPGTGGNVHFTRLHFRYNRNSFPQDLQFQVTPNTETFQARYVITHPANGDFNCMAGRTYLNELRQRRRNELKNLQALTGLSLQAWQQLSKGSTEESEAPQATYFSIMEDMKQTPASSDTPAPIYVLGFLAIGAIGVMRWKGIV